MTSPAVIYVDREIDGTQPLLPGKESHQRRETGVHPLGSAHPPTAFVEPEAAALNRQRLALLELQRPVN